VHATFGFQYGRVSPFSPWGLYHWRTAQQIAQVLLALALAAAVLRPRVRDARQIAAGVAAAVLGSEIVLQHWFYLYIAWFIGPLLLVLVAGREMAAAPLAQAGNALAASTAQDGPGLDPEPVPSPTTPTTTVEPARAPARPVAPQPPRMPLVTERPSDSG